MSDDISLKEERNKVLDIFAESLGKMLADDIIKYANDIFEVTLRATDGVKIQIYPRDHNPPHFHVKAGKKSASFDIQTGELMRGSLGHSADKIVHQFHQDHQQMLLKMWNETRPGIISEGISYMFN